MLRYTGEEQAAAEEVPVEERRIAEELVAIAAAVAEAQPAAAAVGVEEVASAEDVQAVARNNIAEGSEQVAAGTCSQHNHIFPVVEAAVVHMGLHSAGARVAGVDGNNYRRRVAVAAGEHPILVVAGREHILEVVVAARGVVAYVARMVPAAAAVEVGVAGEAGRWVAEADWDHDTAAVDVDEERVVVADRKRNEGRKRP